MTEQEPSSEDNFANNPALIQERISQLTSQRQRLLEANQSQTRGPAEGDAEAERLRQEILRLKKKVEGVEGATE